MKAIKVIKGTPIYIYRGTQYLDKPDKLIYHKMKYDEDENITYVYLKKKRYLTEVICSLIIALCVYVTVTDNTDSTVDVNYNNLIVYYNGSLYVNWHNPEVNRDEVLFDLYDGNTCILSRTLYPGDTVVTVPLDDCADKYRLVISTVKYGKTITSEASITVMNKDDY